MCKAQPVLGLSVEAMDAKAIADRVPDDAASVRDEGESNQYVLEAVRSMPKGGGWGSELGSKPVDVSLHTSMVNGKLKVSTARATPSYCTLATHLVLLKYIELLQNEGKIKLKPEVTQKLLMRGESDGQGIWGRWNANGPGMSVLAHQLGIGTSFNDSEQARPGDFLKIFWSSGEKAAGATERGHTVVFLKKEIKDGREYVYFWSSNNKQKKGDVEGGYGVRRVLASSMHHMIFTRLKPPAEVEAALNENVLRLSETDDYLAGLKKTTSSLEEADRRSGIEPRRELIGEPARTGPAQRRLFGD